MAGGQHFSYYFETGDESAIRTWLAPYAAEFAGCRAVLDIGCGPGTFLQLLAERGVTAIGIDPDPELVAVCQRRGLEAAAMYANDLPRLAGEFDGVHIGHVVEHLTGAQLDALLRHVVERLAPDGRLLIRTPNWSNGTVQTGGFWLDHTHQRPYPADLICKILEGLGLVEVAAATEPNGWEDTVVRARKPSPPAAAAPMALRWEGPLFKRHSLSLVNRELCRELAVSNALALEIADTYEPSDGPDFDAAVDPRFARLAALAAQGATSTGQTVVRHEFPPNADRPDGDVWILMQPWEVGAIPKSWLPLMRDHVDEVWVYTEATRRAYLRCGVPDDRVHVIPLGVDPARFRPWARPMPLPTDRAFRFLFVGGTIWRKGIDILLDAYASTFTADDDVALVIKDTGVATTYRGQTAQARIAELRARPGAPEIVYVDAELPDEHMPGLYTACDALVQPYRGEGFGLPIAEAMACGLPPIVTGYGAALDFCAPDRALLIPATETEDTDGRFAAADLVTRAWWGEPDRESLAAALQLAVERPDDLRRLGARGAAWVRDNLTWRHTAQAVGARLAARSQSAATAAGSPPTAGAEVVIAYPDWSGAVDSLDRAVAAASADRAGVGRLVFLVDPDRPDLIARATERLRHVAQHTPASDLELVLFSEFRGDVDLPELLKQGDQFVTFGESPRQQRLAEIASAAGLHTTSADALPTGRPVAAADAPNR